jgi:hypothetical protein
MAKHQAEELKLGQDSPNKRRKKTQTCSCGSGKRPSFNEFGISKAICCAACKTKTMVNVNHKQCICGKRPSFNLPGEKTGICCIDCKTSEMVDVWHKTCVCGSNIRPIFNLPGATKPVFCTKCKHQSMVNIVSRFCQCGSGKLPSYNEIGQKERLFCGDCKTATMIDVHHNKCPCGKRPNFNEPGQTKGICCVKCKTATMVDVVNIKCPGGAGFTCPYSHRGKEQYRGHCAQCFRQNFPTDPLTLKIRCKTKEIMVRDFINLHYTGFQHDKTMETGNCDCTNRRRIDHRKLFGGTLLAIETDENQHKSRYYMDGETRDNDLFMAHSGKWIYIRFNPDNYVDSKGKLKKTQMKTRLETLKTEIDRQIQRIERGENIELIERIYLFYDGYEK